jgi:hypothetical protein
MGKYEESGVRSQESGERKKRRKKKEERKLFTDN